MTRITNVKKSGAPEKRNALIRAWENNLLNHPNLCCTDEVVKWVHVFFILRAVDGVRPFIPVAMEGFNSVHWQFCLLQIQQTCHLLLWNIKSYARPFRSDLDPRDLRTHPLWLLVHRTKKKKNPRLADSNLALELKAAMLCCFRIWFQNDVLTALLIILWTCWFMSALARWLGMRLWSTRQSPSQIKENLGMQTSVRGVSLDCFISHWSSWLQASSAKMLPE